MGSKAHLLHFGQALLDQPPLVAPLEGFGQPAQVTERKRRNMGSHGQLTWSVRAGQLKGDEPGQRPSKRRVLPHLVAKPQRPCRFGQVEVEAVSVDFEAVVEPPQKPRGRRAEYFSFTYTGLMKRAVIYTRISEDRDGTKDSPETQERECREFCRRKEWDVVGVYSDRDRSAYKRGVKRPEFDRLLSNIRGGQADILVAYKLDRLTRGGMTAIGPILQDLQDANADMAFVHDNVDTTTPMGEGVLGLLASIAKQESKNISTRVKSASRRAAEEGTYPSGGVRTFGFDRTGLQVEAEVTVVLSLIHI